jgi:hypothetical protein
VQALDQYIAYLVEPPLIHVSDERHHEHVVAQRDQRHRQGVDGVLLVLHEVLNRASHLVEAPRECSDLVTAVDHDAGVEIAACHLLGGTRQLLDRAHQGARKGEGDTQYGSEDEDQPQEDRVS